MICMVMHKHLYLLPSAATTRTFLATTRKILGFSFEVWSCLDLGDWR